MGTLEQPSFASLEFQNKKRKTRREAFLERMDALIPWERLEERIRPHYPKAGRGRQPYDLSVMLRVHIVQVCYNLSDPGMEALLYEAESVRRFVGLRLIDPLPDESTILHFRHLLERHNLGQGLFTEVKEYLAEQGVWLKEGTIVDATIIEVPSSTKNRSGQRDPEKSSSCKPFRSRPDGRLQLRSRASQLPHREGPCAATEEIYPKTPGHLPCSSLTQGLTTCR